MFFKTNPENLMNTFFESRPASIGWAVLALLVVAMFLTSCGTVTPSERVVIQSPSAAGKQGLAKPPVPAPVLQQPAVVVDRSTEISFGPDIVIRSPFAERFANRWGRDYPTSSAFYHDHNGYPVDRYDRRYSSKSVKNLVAVPDGTRMSITGPKRKFVHKYWWELTDEDRELIKKGYR